jgi:hypothetical protein
MLSIPIYLIIHSQGVRTSVSELVASETAIQIVLSHQWTGENQLLSPEDILDTLLDRLKTMD